MRDGNTAHRNGRMTQAKAQKALVGRCLDVCIDDDQNKEVKRISCLVVLKKKDKTADKSNADSGRNTLEICGPDTPAAQADAILQDDFARRLLASLPVSILYSELIAEMLAGLSGVPGWDADAMRSSTGRTRWFL